MKRHIFLTIVSSTALLVGAFIFTFPELVLISKGVSVNAAIIVWVREVGIIVFAVGILNFLVRDHKDSPTLKMVLIGNMCVQLGLAPIEVIAYMDGTISDVNGIIPNTILHILLASAFLYYSIKMHYNLKNNTPPNP